MFRQMCAAATFALFSLLLLTTDIQGEENADCWTDENCTLANERCTTRGIAVILPGRSRYKCACKLGYQYNENKTECQRDETWCFGDSECPDEEICCQYGPCDSSYKQSCRMEDACDRDYLCAGRARRVPSGN